MCALFGPSAAGGAYIPAFCDFVAMVDGNASMYLGSPRMVEMVVREKTTLEEMGGARMHCTVSGCGHYLAESEQDAIDAVRGYLSYLPGELAAAAARAPRPASPSQPTCARWSRPASGRRSTCAATCAGWSTRIRLFEIHALWARELIVGFARLDGQVIGVVANNPMFKGGVLFVDSADKATRFIQLCDAFNVPLLFLADVPGFMVGTAVERQGIIRHGAKMISAVAEATVPKICVVVRKAYGAGPVRDGRARVRAGRHAGAADREDRGDGRRGGRQRGVLQQAGRDRRPGRAGEGDRSGCARSTTPISTCSGWPANWSWTTSSSPRTCARELIRRFAAARGKDRSFSRRRHGVTPV